MLTESHEFYPFASSMLGVCRDCDQPERAAIHHADHEVDYAGNPVCGQDFMAGTICSDVPGHDGGCSATCQTCGGDWINDTCGCYERCTECGAPSYDHYAEHEGGVCEDCRVVNWCGQVLPNPVFDLAGNMVSSPARCRLKPNHDGAHHFQSEPTSIPPRDLRRRPAFEPVTQQEIYEVFGITP